MSNALTKMLLFMYITWHCFHFHVFVSIFDSMLKYAEIRNHINITEDVKMHMFSSLANIILCDQHTNVLIHIRSIHPTPPISLFYPLAFCSSCIILLTVCLFYLDFFLSFLNLSESISIYHFFRIQTFSHIFFPCVVFFSRHNITIHHIKCLVNCEKKRGTCTIYYTMVRLLVDLQFYFFRECFSSENLTLNFCFVSFALFLRFSCVSFGLFSISLKLKF